MSARISHAPVEVTAQQTSNLLDVHVALRHADGSLATITYSTDGDSRFPKETLDVSGNGRNARLDNFSRAGGVEPLRQGRQTVPGPGQGPTPGTAVLP